MLLGNAAAFVGDADVQPELFWISPASSGVHAQSNGSVRRGSIDCVEKYVRDDLPQLTVGDNQGRQRLVFLCNLQLFSIDLLLEDEEQFLNELRGIG
jgi:hypothetical protein